MIRMANTKEPSATLLGSIARPKPAARLGEPKRISDFVVAGSYNWLDEKDPTILVPGNFPIVHCHALVEETAESQPLQVYPQYGAHQLLLLF